MSNTAVAIVDTPADTRPWLAQLKTQQVQVVIRYLARGWSATLPHLRIAGNGPGDPCKDGHYFPGTGGSEAAQLLNNGFGMVLVYEWKSSNPSKFLFGVDTAGHVNPNDPGTDHAARAAAEADADIAAANIQTAAIGLPDAPIYFTLDFDLQSGSGTAQNPQGNPLQYSDGTPISNDTVLAACDAYFHRLQQKLGVGRLGVYGNGFANQYMRSRGYVTYLWVAQSLAFANTAKFLRTGPWHLFQQMDWYWFGNGTCPSGLDIDTDIQNPAVTDIGAIGKNGPYHVDAARTQAIFNARYVAVRSVPIRTAKNAAAPAISAKFCDTDGSANTITISTVGHNHSVRVLDDDGTWLTVDINEDGVAEGYAFKTGNFVINIKDMPDYNSAGT
jgi:hypothetical protein